MLAVSVRVPQRPACTSLGVNLRRSTHNINIYRRYESTSAVVAVQRRVCRDLAKNRGRKMEAVPRRPRDMNTGEHLPPTSAFETSNVPREIFDAKSLCSWGSIIRLHRVPCL